MSKGKPKPTLTEALKAAIERSGLTQYRIADATGITGASLCRFMQGETSLRLDKADRLAAYLGLVVIADPDATPPQPTPENLARPMLVKRGINRKDKGMVSKAETQESRTARVKVYLKNKPGVPCEMMEIGRATGVPKSRIDYQRMLSSDPEILREKRDDGSGRRRIFWTYVGK